MKKKSVSENYVNNAEFYDAIVKYRERVSLAKSLGKTPPRMPDFIGSCIMKITNGIASRPNFSGYTYISEMKSNAIENCIAKFDNFNHEKWDRPFSYFYRIIYWSFLRTIKNEKLLQAQKTKYMNKMVTLQEIAAYQGNEFSGAALDNKVLNKIMNDMNERLDDFESKRVKKPKKKTHEERTLEEFYEEAPDPSHNH